MNGPDPGAPDIQYWHIMGFPLKQKANDSLTAHDWREEGATWRMIAETTLIFPA